MSELSRFFMEDQTEHLCVMIQQMLMRLHTICHLWDQPSNSRHNGGPFEYPDLGCRVHVHSLPELHADILEAFDRAREILSIIDSAKLALDRLLWEFGHCLFCEKLSGPSDLPGLSWDK
ncbi:hypothetical protein V8B97DRAFT_1960005 [Scleroderma yunnanense]